MIKWQEGKEAEAYAIFGKDLNITSIGRKYLGSFIGTKAGKEEFMKQLAYARADYTILEEDFCGYDSGGQPSQVTCTEHFGVEITE